MAPKSADRGYLDERHADDVATLLKYIRYCKQGFYLLLFVIFVNVVLTYNLITYPTTQLSCIPNAEICAACTVAYPRLAIDQKPTFADVKVESRSVEVAVRDSDVSLKEADTSQQSNELAELNERRIWWVLAMAAVGATNQAFSWYSLVSACMDFSGPSAQAQCIWGAVSTAILYGGAMYGAAQNIGRIQTWIGNNGITIGGWKREDISGLAADLSQIIGSPVEHLGHFDYVAPSPNGKDSLREESSPLAVFGITNPHGIPMHFSYIGKTDGKPTFKFGLGNGTIAAATRSSEGGVKGREAYDEQYFSSGGVDFTVTENRGEGGYLSTSGDFAQMFDEVSCLMKYSMAAAGHWYQVFDEDRKGTIVGGAIAPFAPGNHWSVISAMTGDPWPIGETSYCEVA